MTVDKPGSGWIFNSGKRSEFIVLFLQRLHLLIILWGVECSINWYWNPYTCNVNGRSHQLQIARAAGHEQEGLLCLTWAKELKLPLAKPKGLAKDMS